MLSTSATPRGEKRDATTGLLQGVTAFLQHRLGDCIKDRYEIKERLGGGNFGSVYRVHDTAVGNELACKEMHVLDDPATSGNERARAIDSFKREALNLATLRHPHIPAAYYEQEDGFWHICPRCGFDFPGRDFCPQHNAALLLVTERYYLMMDYVDGPTLEEMACSSGQPLDETRCIEWTAQIASALRALHRVGIVHRDVKPDNIKIRSADDAAVLLDFGLTKKAEEAGGYGTVAISGTGRFGTPGYAPPSPQEQEHPEPRSDIYALGMTLLRMLSGRDPQDAGDLAELREYSARRFNAAISPETERVIQLSVAAQREKRYQNIDDLLADLNDLRGESDAAYQAPPFTFADGSRARNGRDLARLVEKHPNEALNYLWNGMFADWLTLCGLAAPAQVARAAVRRYANNPARALEIFRRALYPTGTPGVLPQLQIEPAALDFGALDSGAASTLTLKIRNTGPGLLWGQVAMERAGADKSNPEPLPGLSCTPHFQGNETTLEVKLETGRVPAGAYSGALVLQTDAQTVRVPVSYSVNALDLRISPPEIDFGNITVGRRETQFFRVVAENHTTGKPRGTIFTGAHLAGAETPERFDGDEPIKLTVDASRPGLVATQYEGAVHLDTNGGRLRLPVRYRIVLPPDRIIVLVIGALLLGAVGGAALRLAYALVNPEYATNWLLTIRPGGAALASFELKHWWLPLLGAMGGVLLASTWADRRQAQLNAQATAQARPTRRRSEMLTWMPFFGMFAGAAGIFALAFLLHWGVWSFGDWLLYPLTRSLAMGQSAVSELPPVAWSLAGATVGALWGLSRAFSSTGHSWARYAAYGVLGVLFLVVLLNAMLSVG